MVIGLAESQSIWIHSFEDYVDDFVYFVTTIAKEYANLPTYLLAHSMGGLISSIAMSRQPTLINRAVLCAPMFRNKCGMKSLDFRFPLPQPLTYWITSLMCYAGLGTMHALGFFKEKPSDKLSLNVVTSDQEQLDKWQALRAQYPNLIATCVTNDWVLHSIRAQKKFALRYEFVRTNTLVLRYYSLFFLFVRLVWYQVDFIVCKVRKRTIWSTIAPCLLLSARLLLLA